MLFRNRKLLLVSLSILLLNLSPEGCQQKSSSGNSTGAAPQTAGQPIAQTPNPTTQTPYTNPTGGNSNLLEKCRFFDANQNIVQTITGVPIPVDISNYTANQVPTGDVYNFSFTLYRDYYNGNDWVTTWQTGDKARIPVQFNATITEATTAYCQIVINWANLEQRTLYGCFAEGTLIRLADGADYPIEQLIPGHKVLNPLTGEAMTVTAISRGPERKPMYKITTLGGSSVEVTENHPFLTAYGLKAAKDLVESDTIIGADGSYLILSSIAVMPADASMVVYNLRFATKSAAVRDHMVLANGIIAGDLFLQESLEAGKL